MIEAVGYRMADVLHGTGPDARTGWKDRIQSDHHAAQPDGATRNTHGWIHKYIFPGGLLPSVEAIERTVDRYPDLNVCDRLSFGEHHAATLRLWRERFKPAGTNCTNWASMKSPANVVAVSLLHARGLRSRIPRRPPIRPGAPTMIGNLGIIAAAKRIDDCGRPRCDVLHR